MVKNVEFRHLHDPSQPLSHSASVGFDFSHV